MGAALRAFRNFNVETRAHKLIGKDKLSAAPMHPGTKEKLADIITHHPEIQEKIYTKDDELLTRLKDVYVDSTDPLHEVKPAVLSPAKEFRAARQTITGVFSHMEADSIPKGKISIVEAMTALNQHKGSPQTWTAERIAEEYNLNIQDSKSLLAYFRPFNVEVVSKTERIEED